MEDNNVAILIEAKTEYNKQIIKILRHHLYNGIKRIYNESKDICNDENNMSFILIQFQELLSKIPKWSNEIKEKEYTRIVTKSNCDWLEDLITAVFICHTKVLSIINNNIEKKVNIKIPKPVNFIHLCYIEAAREFWKNPYLFSENV